jgi:cleavage stimulation factor subunit 3
VSFFEQQQVMDQTRKLFHRALLMPIEGIESLWHAYDAYENGLNKLTVQGSILIMLLI